MPRGFRWQMGNYVGGQQAVHQSYKPWLAIESGDPLDPGAPGQNAGEFDVTARYTGPIVVTGLGFQPDIIFLASYRPRRHNGHTDTSFGNRGGGMTFGVANALQQFTGSTRAQQGFDFHMGIKRWREDVCFNVISVTPPFPPTVGEDILTMELTSLDADGFTLDVTLNLYDETDNVFWMAMKGDYQVGIMDAGQTSIGGFSGVTPTGAIFLSTRSVQDITYDLALWDGGTAYLIGDSVEWRGAYWQATANHTGSEPPSANWVQLSPPAPNGHEINNWDHVQGVAAENGQACVWGGARSTSWNWTTEYWTDEAAILLGNAANGSFFVGASVLAKGQVISWDPGGIDLQWPIFNNTPYRIGYVLVGNPSEQGVIETNWETRPGGSQNDPPGSGYNFEETTVKPYTVFMTGTNYTFDYSDTDPFDNPRTPDTFQSGGGGGMGWHVYPYSVGSGDAWSVHTYANGRAELGHYANSATKKARGCIMDGAGANSQPPAAHQHCVNIVPLPRYVGMNWRYAQRHTVATRALQNPDDDVL